MDAPALYAALAALQIGDTTPADCYILDYADNQRPMWTVVEREALDADGVKLTLHDQDNAGLFACVQLVILTFPTKTLRTGPHLSCDEMPGKLCDLRQRQRHAVKTRRAV